MSHVPHILAEEFPEFVDRIGQLKQSDAHFSRLCDEYHELNRTIHRAETNVEPVEDLAEVELRKRRMALKDEIYGILTASEGAQ
ncbi:YdcH family protein [Pseudoruegeria sp. HB172150]|uniref:YdcH family protein n=1 Tax=Pseudoruegeria sp. HB172150 TaxID=2721164 RepID=UPI001555E744|nr:YdcH family protein [Pseudoruegeria sp. HB172150]